MNQTKTECPHQNVGKYEHTVVRKDEFDRPEYYVQEVDRCQDCGTIAPEPPRTHNPDLPNILTFQMDYNLRAKIMSKYGYRYTPTGKSVKCNKCGHTWGIRHWKSSLNHQLLRHAYEHEIEESEERDERPE